MMTVKNHSLYPIFVALMALVMNLEMAGATTLAPVNSGSISTSSRSGQCDSQEASCQLFADAVDSVDERSCYVDVGRTGTSPEDGKDFIHDMSPASEFSIKDVRYYENAENLNEGEIGEATRALRDFSKDSSATLGQFKKGASFSYSAGWDHDGFYEDNEEQTHTYTMKLFVGYDEQSYLVQSRFCTLVVERKRSAIGGRTSTDSEVTNNSLQTLQNSAIRRPTPNQPGRSTTTGRNDIPKHPRDVAGQAVRDTLHSGYGEEEQEEVRRFMQSPVMWGAGQVIDLFNGSEEDRRSPIERRDAEDE